MFVLRFVIGSSFAFIIFKEILFSKNSSSGWAYGSAKLILKSPARIIGWLLLFISFSITWERAWEPAIFDGNKASILVFYYVLMHSINF